MWQPLQKRKVKRNDRPGILRCLLILLLVSLAACHDDPSEELFLKAGDALREGRVEEALSYYAKTASLYPHTETAQEAYYWIGEIYRLFKHQPGEAIGFFRKGAAEGRLSRYGEKAQKNIAEIYLREYKDYKKAIPELQRLIDRFPASRFVGEAQYRIGQCYMALKEYDQARIEYSLLLDRYGAGEYRDDGAYRICVAYEREGDFAAARREYESFLTRYPDSPLVRNARLGLANALEELGEIDLALKQLASLEKEYSNEEVILRKLDALLKKKNAGKSAGASKHK